MYLFVLVYVQDGKVSGLSEEVLYVEKGLLHVSNIAPVKGSDRYGWNFHVLFLLSNDFYMYIRVSYA